MIDRRIIKRICNETVDKYLGRSVNESADINNLISRAVDIVLEEEGYGTAAGGSSQSTKIGYNDRQGAYRQSDKGGQMGISQRDVDAENERMTKAKKLSRAQDAVDYFEETGLSEVPYYYLNRYARIRNTSLKSALISYYRYPDDFKKYSGGYDYAPSYYACYGPKGKVE